MRSGWGLSSEALSADRDGDRVVSGPDIQIGSSLLAADGAEHEVDLVAASDDADSPGNRTITALREAKSGEELTFSHLNQLEGFRDALGDRANDAVLLLFGTRFANNLVSETKGRSDVELVDVAVCRTFATLVACPRLPPANCATRPGRCWIGSSLVKP